MDGNAKTRSARRAARHFSGAGRLRDGTPVQLRPLVAEDRDLLLAGFATLSDRSRRSRFLRGISDAQFERMLPVLLDTVDQRSHVPLLLYADGRPIGVGRLRRFPSDPSAERRLDGGRHRCHRRVDGAPTGPRQPARGRPSGPAGWRPLCCRPRRRNASSLTRSSTKPRRPCRPPVKQSRTGPVRDKDNLQQPAQQAERSTRRRRPTRPPP